MWKLTRADLQPLLMIAILVSIAATILAGPDTAAGVPILLVTAAVAHIVALLPFAFSLTRSDRGRGQLRTRLLAAGLALLSLSLLARAWLWLPSNIASGLIIPTLSELLALSGLLAILGALVWVGLERSRRFGRIGLLLDYSVLVVGVGSLTWLVMLEPPIILGMSELARTLWLGLAPMLDLILIAILGRQWLTGSLGRHQLRNSGLLSWLVLRLIADLIYGFGLIQDQPVSVSGPGIGWSLSAMALSVALRIEPLHSRESPAQPPHDQSLMNRIGHQLPVIVVYLVVGFALLDRWSSGAFDPFAVVVAGVLVVLLLARQGVISGQAEMMQYASLVDSAADLAFVIDKEGRFILTNPAFQKATGVGTDSRRHVAIQEVVSDDERAAQVVRQAAVGGWTGELLFQALDGTPFPVQLSLMPVYDERRGESVMAGTGHDLTEIKQREQQLRNALSDVDRTRAELAELNVALERKVSERTSELEQLVSHLETLNEELTQLDQLKSEFVTLVSHELRSPLTNIRSGLELTLRREKAGLSKGGRDSLDLVLQEAERLTGFVETILDLSALEAGRFPMDIRPVDARATISLARNRFSGGQASRISFTPPQPSPLVLADETSLASVLFHLLDNALKYSSGEVEVRVADQGDSAVISVLDSGPGIPPQSRETVFDRFHRLDSSDSREVYGHGLGLYLCRRLAEAMGGSVTLSDDHSPGSRFEVSLPTTDASGPSISRMPEGHGKSNPESKAG